LLVLGVVSNFKLAVSIADSRKVAAILHRSADLLSWLHLLKDAVSGSAGVFAQTYEAIVWFLCAEEDCNGNQTQQQSESDLKYDTSWLVVELGVALVNIAANATRIIQFNVKVELKYSSLTDLAAIQQYVDVAVCEYE
jgi:hypothetical protein